MPRTCAHTRWLLPLAGFLVWTATAAAQSLDETVTFLTEFTAKQGLIRAPSCKAEEAGRPTAITEMYAAIPMGTNLGLVELNHGTPNGRTGHTLFDLHDVRPMEIGGEERVDPTRAYQTLRVTCTGDRACIEKLTYCGGEVRERRTQVKTDVLYFRGASAAERALKAFTHLHDLITAKDKTSPF